MADTFTFELVSPERLMVSRAVRAVVVPALEGEMTVMAGHAPTMTLVKPGVVTVTAEDGTEERLAVFGGFADITPQSCTLLAEAGMAVSQVTRDEMERRLTAARTEVETARSASDHHRLTKAEDFLHQLTTLNGTLLPA